MNWHKLLLVDLICAKRSLWGGKLWFAAVAPAMWNRMKMQWKFAAAITFVGRAHAGNDREMVAAKQSNYKVKSNENYFTIDRRAVETEKNAGASRMTVICSVNFHYEILVVCVGFSRSKSWWYYYDGAHVWRDPFPFSIVDIGSCVEEYRAKL